MEYTDEKLVATNSEGFYTEDGWWIDSADDVYDEHYGNEDPIESIAESYDTDDFLSPFKFVITSIKYQHRNERNADGTQYKIRPVLLVLRTRDGYRGFSVTSQPPKENGYATNFRMMLPNWRSYGLDLLSGINYEHLSFVPSYALRKNLHTRLSRTDVKRLYDELKKNYDVLVERNYDQRHEYKKLMKVLETYLEMSDDSEDDEA